MRSKTASRLFALGLLALPFTAGCGENSLVEVENKEQRLEYVAELDMEVGEHVQDEITQFTQSLDVAIGLQSLDEERIIVFDDGVTAKYQRTVPSGSVQQEYDVREFECGGSVTNFRWDECAQHGGPILREYAVDGYSDFPVYGLTAINEREKDVELGLAYMNGSRERGEETVYALPSGKEITVRMEAPSQLRHMFAVVTEDTTGTLTAHLQMVHPWGGEWLMPEVDGQAQASHYVSLINPDVQLSRKGFKDGISVADLPQFAREVETAIAAYNSQFVAQEK